MAKNKDIVRVRMNRERLEVIDSAITGIDNEINELNDERVALERLRARVRAELE